MALAGCSVLAGSAETAGSALTTTLEAPDLDDLQLGATKTTFPGSGRVPDSINSGPMGWSLVDFDGAWVSTEASPVTLIAMFVTQKCLHESEAAGGVLTIRSFPGKITRKNAGRSHLARTWDRRASRLCRHGHSVTTCACWASPSWVPPACLMQPLTPGRVGSDFRRKRARGKRHIIPPNMA